MRVYHTIDKSAWGPGPWQDEPDKMEWRDEATGLPCLIVRRGALCGYVGVPPGHPRHGSSDYDDCYDLSVHGGVTFTGACQDGPQESVVCHAITPGEPDNVWWIGFDCAHAGDLIPDMPVFPGLSLAADTYRDIAYVQQQIAGLAQQLCQMEESV